MGLFTRRQTTEHAQFYTLSGQKTKLVVGLGNVGAEFKGTRHNVGFACVDYFATANDFPAWSHKKDFQADVTNSVIAGTRVIVMKPTTFMNLSGEAVQAVQHFYKISNFDTLVIHDELALPFGQLRVRIGGSDAGNNGIKSVIAHNGEDFGRIRIGIANDISGKADASEFVLGKFTTEEARQLDTLYKEVNALVNECVLAPEFSSETRSFIV